MIEIGDPVPLRLTTRNALKAPTDVTSVTLTITQPDGTTVSPLVAHVAATGIYTASFTVTQLGMHTYRWVATDPVNGGTFVDEFTVDDGYVPFVSLSEQLNFMQATATITDPVELEELRGLIRVACEAVELDLGRYISPQTVTRSINGGGSTVVLRGPVLSVASVVENGVTLVAGTGYVVDVASGILYRGSTQGVQCFASGLQNTVITYRAGELRPSAVARKVAKNGAARMWQGRQMPHPALDDLGAEMVAPLGVLTPLELAGYMKLKRPGLA